MTSEEIAELIQWIVSEGLDGSHETRILEGVCTRLEKAGIPLQRVNISQPTLHPVIGGHLFIWHRGEGVAVQEDWQRNVSEAGQDYSRTPFEHMMTSGIQLLRCHLLTGEGCDEFPMLERFRGAGATDYFALQTDFAADRLRQRPQLGAGTAHSHLVAGRFTGRLRRGTSRGH
jgi:hypothetical protein